LDGRLRRDLAQAPEVVDRVVRRALSAGPEATQRRVGPRALAVVGTVSIVLALAIVGFLRTGDGSGGEGGARRVPIIGNPSGSVVVVVDGENIWPGTGGATAPTPASKRPVIFNSNGLVAVALPHGNPQFLILGGK